MQCFKERVLPRPRATLLQTFENRTGLLQVFLSRAAAAFESCWHLDALDAVAVMARPRPGGLPVYTYLPYHPGQCHDLRPRLAAVWSSARSPAALAPAALGLVDKVRDLGGCPLRVTVIQARPWTDLQPGNAAGRFLVRGTYGWVCRTGNETRMIVGNDWATKPAH